MGKIVERFTFMRDGNEVVVVRDDQGKWGSMGTASTCWGSYYCFLGKRWSCSALGDTCYTNEIREILDGTRPIIRHELAERVETCLPLKLRHCLRCAHCDCDVSEQPCVQCYLTDRLHWRPCPPDDTPCTEEPGISEPAQSVPFIGSSDLKQAQAKDKPHPFLRALSAVWDVVLYGAQKYSPNNCFSVGPADMETYEEALWRHWQARRRGQRLDPESKLPELAHMAWNALFMLEMELRGVTSDKWPRESADEVRP